MDERIFDVTKPDKVKPDATGKPIIVGHHPEVVDPTIRENAPDKPQPVAESPAHLEHHKEVSPLGLPDELAAATVPPILAGETISPQPAVEEPPAGGAAEPKPAEPADKPPNLSPTEPTVQKPAAAAGIGTQHTAPKARPLSSGWRPEHPLPISSGHGDLSWRGKKTPLIAAGAILLLIAGYLLLTGGGLLERDDKVSVTPVEQAPVAAPVLTQFQISGTDIVFSYPTAWGTATATKEPGFTKRGGANQSDGTYAHLVNFAVNKDIQIVATASQYLPAARGPLYYDFQQWCTGTADAKIYKQQLKFTSANGIDTPTTAVCDQGPLEDAAKLDATTIFQPKFKNADGSVLGDLYTKNLAGNDLPVLRVKDAASAHGGDIKKLLATVKD